MEGTRNLVENMTAHYEPLNGDLYSYDYFLQDDVCRLCWRRDAEREILPKTSQKVTIMKNELMDQLRNCLDLDFTDDTYPNKVCNECYNKVQEFDAFKCFCQEADRKLCEIFRKQREEVTKDAYLELKVEPGYFDTVDSFYESTNTSDHEPADIDTKAPVKEEIKKEKIKRGTKFRNYCYICKIDCKTKETFLSHKSQLHGVEENGTKFKCFGCEKRFRSVKRRGAHEREFCKALKDGYKCLKCDRYLPNRKAYELHMIAHRKNKVVDLPELSFECKSCCLEFKTVQRFRDHMNSVHPETRKKYVCEMCGRVFNRADYLYKHKKTHSGSKPHACAHCAFRTSQRTTLIMHMRRHTGERPYMCDVCPQRCVSSSNLRAHRRTHLGQDKQHECNICSKKFSYKLSLEEHISSCHDRSQSFICDHCGATYNRQRGLRRHLAAKHGQLTEKKDGGESTVLDESVCE